MVTVRWYLRYGLSYRDVEELLAERGITVDWLTMITGARRGEVSALRWRHVDFDRAVLWIHRSNAQTKAGIKEKETKTGQRRKVAPVHD
jgi:integrase